MSGRNISEIELQIMWNRLLSVVEEQAQTLVRTAFSTSSREAGDISAGVFDLESRTQALWEPGKPNGLVPLAGPLEKTAINLRAVDLSMRFEWQD